MLSIDIKQVCCYLQHLLYQNVSCHRLVVSRLVASRHVSVAIDSIGPRTIELCHVESTDPHLA